LSDRKFLTRSRFIMGNPPHAIISYIFVFYICPNGKCPKT